MLRSIVGVVVGYVVMMLVAFAAYTAAYYALGVERAFEPGTYVLSGLWIGLVIAITFVAGLFGGLTCAAISRSQTSGLVLALIVFVLSLVFELPSMLKNESPRARTGEVSNMDVMGEGQAPVWLCILIPILGGAGVILGARMKKSPGSLTTQS